MKKLSILLLCLISFQVSFSQNLTSVEEVFTNVKMEVDDNCYKYKVYIGDEYFGIATPLYRPRTEVSYRHYDMEGHLLWSISNFDYDIYWINISQKGNRVLIWRGPNKEAGELESVTEVYDQNGGLLFAAPLPGYIFYSSPNGKYYFSKPGFEGPHDILFLDNKGDFLFNSGIVTDPEVHIEAIDDSTLLIFNDVSIRLFDIKQNEEILEGIIAGFFFNFAYSTSTKYSMMWSDNDLSILDKNLIEVSRSHYDLDIMRVDIDKEAATIGLILYDPNSGDIYCRINSIDGSLITSQAYIFPSGEYISDFGELSYDGKYFIHRYIGFDRVAKKGIPHRTMLFILDQKSKCISQHNCLSSWLFDIKNSTEYLDVSSNKIKFISK